MATDLLLFFQAVSRLARMEIAKMAFQVFLQHSRAEQAMPLES